MSELTYQMLQDIVEHEFMMQEQFEESGCENISDLWEDVLISNAMEQYANKTY